MLAVLKKNQKGLTLIELLAVLIIIGIIAAIAIPAIGATIRNAEEKADQANLQMIEEAAQRYILDHTINEFPTGQVFTYTDGVATFTGTNIMTGAAGTGLVPTLRAAGYLSDNAFDFKRLTITGYTYTLNLNTNTVTVTAPVND